MSIQSIKIQEKQTYREPISGVILAIKSVGTDYVYLRIQLPRKQAENKYLDLGDSYYFREIISMSGFYIQSINEQRRSVIIEFFEK